MIILDILGFVFAMCIIALPFLLWGKLFSYSLSAAGDHIGPTTVCAAALIGIPTYFYILVRILEASSGQ